jgi:hypothetical protein
MLAVKTRFDGKKVLIPKELRGCRPGEVILILESSEETKEQPHAWMKAQESAFAKVWDNDEDAIYDDL